MALSYLREISRVPDLSNRHWPRNEHGASALTLQHNRCGAAMPSGALTHFRSAYIPVDYHVFMSYNSGSLMIQEISQRA